MSYTFEETVLDPQLVMAITERVSWAQLGAAYARLLPEVFTHVTTKGGSPIGPPFGRYLDSDDQEVTLQAGIPVEAHVEATDRIDADTLPGGPVVTTWHVGDYADLGLAHQATAAWFESHDRTTGGAPWESYVTDPAEEPDPAKWRTLVVYPL